jgi:molybdopterin-guanine dinucleotide biosynthesis protein A
MVAALGSRSFARAIVLGVDFPLLRPELLAALLASLPGRAAVVPSPGGVPQPLAAAYAPVAAGRLADRLRDGERGAVAAALALDPLLLGDRELDGLGGAECLLNVNTAADLERAERVLSARARGEAA